MSQFFINRPIFAWVVAIVIMIAGAVSITQISIEQYPKVAPTQVTVNAMYPGATAQLLEENVLAVIEREMNSLKGLAYMETSSSANGSGSIRLSFEPYIDADMAQVDVQNKLSRATPRLPSEVTKLGVTVDQSRMNILMMVAVTSTSSEIGSMELNDYVARNVVNEMSRLKSVGNVMQFGSERSMRIWVKPDVLEGYGLSMMDVTSAIAVQNAQISAGTMGDTPQTDTQMVSFAVVADGQLTNVEEFEQIILRANADGSTIRLGDVARVELGSQTYAFEAKYNDRAIAGIGIQLSSDGNAIEAAKLVREKMDELSRFFPAGMSYEIAYDSTKFISASIDKVVSTLFEAILLVFIVMYLFLQNVRYTVIPTIVVPIALLGAFAALFMMGFSLNVLSMFAMVLVIGIVVDDAIIVVENVERIMSQEGLSPLEATRKAMTQISGAIIGVTVVLVSVFVPMAFFQGATGNIYRQFTATMASAIAFSAFMALSLTPALCATLLKPVAAGHHDEKKGFFGWFNRSFAATTRGYKSLLTKLLRRSKLMMVVYVLIIVAAVALFQKMPTSFLPEEDQGVMIAMAILPAGATANRTNNALEQLSLYAIGRKEVIEGVDPNSVEGCQKLKTYVSDHASLFDGMLNVQAQQDCNAIYALMKGQPEIEAVTTVRGFSFSGQGQNTGLAFIPLVDWSERNSDQSVWKVIERAQRGLGQQRDSYMYILSPPPISELGIASGFEFRLQDRSGNGYEALVNASNELIAKASAHPALTGIRLDSLPDAPRIYLDIDREAAMAQGVSMASISSTLTATLGSSYVNDFVNRGRMQRVVVQADIPYRMQRDQLLDLTVLNNRGDVVPFSSFASLKNSAGPVQTLRFNGYSSMKISGNAAPGYSTGDAMAAMQELATQLPEGFGYEWAGQSREEQKAGAQAIIVYVFAIIAVFLCLAALYESWSIPFSVLLVVPLGIIGVILATLLRGMENDIYFQIGLITIIGLSAKNAILIIEFAKDLQEQGKSLVAAALEAAVLRFRPILMTSLAFTCGVLPLFRASGASAASQQAIGTGVVGGMITGTVLAVIFVPAFFVIVRSIFKGSSRSEENDAEEGVKA